jgi:integrase
VDNDSRVRYLTGDEETSLMTALEDREKVIRQGRASGNEWRKVRQLEPRPDLNALPFADHLKPMVIVSLNTGLRWGELVALTWDKVDMTNANLTVIGTTAKSGKTRHVPLNTTAMIALKKWQNQSTGPVVFPGRDGGTLDNVNRSWNAVLTVAKITDFRWHDMRHHFASRLVMAGVDLNTVRELLGHSDMKMTLRYAHLAPEHKAAAVAKLVNA